MRKQMFGGNQPEQSQVEEDEDSGQQIMQMLAERRRKQQEQQEAEEAIQQQTLSQPTQQDLDKARSKFTFEKMAFKKAPQESSNVANAAAFGDPPKKIENNFINNLQKTYSKKAPPKIRKNFDPTDQFGSDFSDQEEEQIESKPKKAPPKPKVNIKEKLEALQAKMEGGSPKPREEHKDPILAPATETPTDAQPKPEIDSILNKKINLPVVPQQPIQNPAEVKTDLAEDFIMDFLQKKPKQQKPEEPKPEKPKKIVEPSKKGELFDLKNDSQYSSDMNAGEED